MRSCQIGANEKNHLEASFLFLAKVLKSAKCLPVGGAGPPQWDECRLFELAPDLLLRLQAGKEQSADYADQRGL